jgi:hypothetical protein
MAQAVSRRPVTTEAPVRSQVSPYGICGGRIGTGTGFSSSTLVFPYQYHSTSAPYLCSSPCCLYQDKRAKSGNLPKSNALSEIGSIGWKSAPAFSPWGVRVSPCGICDEQSGTETLFSLTVLRFRLPPSFHQGSMLIFVYMPLLPEPGNFHK